MKIKQYIKEGVEVGAILLLGTGTLQGCGKESYKTEEAPIPQVTQTWYGHDLDGDGSYDCITTPHQWIVGARGDSISDIVLDNAEKADDIKTKWAIKQGRPNTCPAYCSVEDIDGDNVADIVSWPRIEGMPLVVNPQSHASYFVPLGTQVKYMSESMQREANTALAMDEFVQTYVQQHLHE